ncbi:MAG: YceI family protein [Rhodothermales bacterium]
MARRIIEFAVRVQLLALLMTCLAPDVAAQTFITREGTATFVSEVPLHEFEGTSSALNGMVALEDSTVDFYLDLETLETGIGKRDRDMRLTLNTDEHPFGEFTGKLVSPLDVGREVPQDAVVRGTFTINGVSREVEITGQLEPVGEALRLTAAWTLRLEDYDIEPPSLLFMKVDSEQDIRIDAVLHTRDP